ncbi:MAG: hypothetical protein WBF58_12005 [Xanthobacteraceae bacterium]
MGNALEYEERAEACRRRAHTLSDPRDRAQWLKLADDWITVSRMQFHTLPDRAAADARLRLAGQQAGVMGLWRAELGAGLRRNAPIFPETFKS